MRRDDERRRGADEQLMGARQRAVVRHRRVRLVVADGHHCDRRDRRDGQQAEDDRDPAPRPARDDGEGARHRQGPHDVELFLDRERPQVADGRGGRERLEVALAGEDEPPVRDVAQGREQVPSKRALGDRVGGRRPDRDDGDQHEQRGQEPSSPAVPELDEVDVAGAQSLADQQRRDEEARQDEEEVDAEEPALQPGNPEVIREHERDRQPACAIERPDVGHRRGARRTGGVEGLHRHGERRGHRLGAAGKVVDRKIGHGRGLSWVSGWIGAAGWSASAAWRPPRGTVRQIRRRGPRPDQTGSTSSIRMRLLMRPFNS